MQAEFAAKSGKLVWCNPRLSCVLRGRQPHVAAHACRGRAAGVAGDALLTLPDDAAGRRPAARHQGQRHGVRRVHGADQHTAQRGQAWSKAEQTSWYLHAKRPILGMTPLLGGMSGWQVAAVLVAAGCCFPQPLGLETRCQSTINPYHGSQWTC